jgi:hypothetical protein
MRKYTNYISIMASLFVLLFGCQTTSSDVELFTLRIEKSLPQSQLEYFSDSFDTFQEGLWEKVPVHMPKTVKEGDFRLGDISIDKGKLKISTKPDCFSKVAIVSKFTLRGDFDIQIDCDTDFMEGKLDRDHYLFFINLHKVKELAKRTIVGISFFKKGENNPGVFRSGLWSHRRFHGQKRLELDRFHGSVRFVKVGQKISTLFKTGGELKWKEMATFPCATEDFKIVIGLQNFIGRKSLTPAKSSISAMVDNFKINAAENIIEEEI